MSDIKSITISKQAAADMIGGMLPAKRRGRTKKNTQGGDSFEQPATTQIIKIDSTPLPKLPLPSSPPPSTTPPVEAPVSATQGGSSTIKPIRVELKRKQETKKVQLQPKKALEPVKSLKKVHGTRKQRKVSLGISTMHRRLTRAKKMQTRVKEMPIEKLKQQLIDKKLIKSTSKAPEMVLRQIAEDAQLLASKAL